MESQQLNITREDLLRKYEACLSLYGTFMARARTETGNVGAWKEVANGAYGGASVLADLLGISCSELAADLQESEDRQIRTAQAELEQEVEA